MLQDFEQLFVSQSARRFENTVIWPYLDTHTPPLLTVGCGCYIPLEEALTLPFTINGLPATQAQIRTEYTRVHTIKAGMNFRYYRYSGCLILPTPAIDALLEKRVQGFSENLRKLYPGFDKFPLNGKAGLLEMIFTLGMEGLELPHYPMFNHAILKSPPDWVTAAKQSGRDTHLEAFNDRNAWVNNQFLLAVKG